MKHGLYSAVNLDPQRYKAACEILIEHQTNQTCKLKKLRFKCLFIKYSSLTRTCHLVCNSSCDIH